MKRSTYKNMIHEKKREENRSKANGSQETKKEQKNKEKLKHHFTSWEPNPRALPHPFSHLPHPTSQHIQTSTHPGLHILIPINKSIVHFIHPALL
jgi:hypothetical protein